MKQPLSHTPSQKCLSLLMACLVFALTLFLPLTGQAADFELSDEQTTLSDASFSTEPALSTTPEPLPKISILYSTLPRLWELMLSVLAPEIQEYRAVYQQLFIRKINFVFVSGLAP